MIKPRITQVGPGVWECACDLVSQRGRTAKIAYDHWLNASLIDAMANLQSVADPEIANLRKIANPEPAPIAKPKAGKPITIKSVPKPLPVVKKQPKYHPSVVRSVPGVVQMKEYRTPASMLDNLSRAEQSEPKLSPMVSNLRFERRVDL